MARGATLGGVLQEFRVAYMARLPSAISHPLRLFPPTNILTSARWLKKGVSSGGHSALFLGTSADPVPEQLTSWLCHVCARAAAVGAALPMAAQNALRSLRFFSDYPDLHKPRLALARASRLAQAKPTRGRKLKKKSILSSLSSLSSLLSSPLSSPLSPQKKQKNCAPRAPTGVVCRPAAVPTEGPGTQPAVLYR